jgi:hypothetical protein
MSQMGHVYQIWVRHAGLVQCRIAGPDMTYFGEGRRGYLTKPAIEFRDAGGRTQFRVGGNRRLAPSQHFLDAQSGERLAVFNTRRISGPVDGAARGVETVHGEEIVTLVPPEAEEGRMANKIRASLNGIWQVTMKGLTVGMLAEDDGSPVHPMAKLGALYTDLRGRIAGAAPRERLVGTLTLDVDLEPRICAALLLYMHFVISPGRTPE